MSVKRAGRLMQIEIDKLTEAGESFAHRYPPDAIALDDERAQVVGETSIEGRASRKNGSVRLRGQLRADLEINCDRCLRAVPYTLESEFDVVYAPAETETEKRELQTEDLEFDVYEADSISTNELAREQILLNLPTRILCKEECQGLCLSCGADLNQHSCGCQQETIDPRWQALKEVIGDG